MLRAILFDMGGTLDGDGEHWLDRFVRLYAANGIELPREEIRKGFDEAERRSATDDAIVRAGVDTLVRTHLRWQFEVHGLVGEGLIEAIARAFVAPVREAGRRNAAVLASLHGRGYALGVVSNACGNAHVLCDDLGYGPYLSCVIDSRVVGVAKPDPAIYAIAVERLDCSPSDAMMVGDSYERDILPARRLGMRTAWLAPGVDRSHRDLADVCISSLAELMPHVADLERTPA